MAIRRRKKRRTQAATALTDDSKTPRSFVFAKGRAGPVVTELVADLKRMMEPHTASRLKARKHNRMRDFLSVAGQYHVNFFMIVSATDRGTYLRLARVPRGPTLQFRIHRFSLAADVASGLRRPHSPSSGEFATPPLLVLHGFSKTDKEDQLATVMFQSLFPPIDVGKLNIKSCRRVVLVHKHKDSGGYHLRQYAIAATPTGMSRPLKQLLRASATGTVGTKLSQLEDISQLLERDGHSSESGAETDHDNENAAVTLPQDYKGRSARKAQQCAIKLTELGPRLEMELLKVEEGLCEGKVIYHKYHRKTSEEAADLEARAQAKVSIKAARQRQQEENIRRKAEAKVAELAERRKRKRRGPDEAAEQRHGEPDGIGCMSGAHAGSGDAPSDDNISDEEWYRSEVGQEPDAGLFKLKSAGAGGGTTGQRNGRAPPWRHH